MGVQVSIGDFAVMTSLSRKALRHYHDVGILEPTHIDPHTGYRFYDTGRSITPTSSAGSDRWACRSPTSRRC